jgi:Na+-translocating ferredoxin:NAD+ oxidoreductase RnfA subunit
MLLPQQQYRVLDLTNCAIVAFFLFVYANVFSIPQHIKAVWSLVGMMLGYRLALLLLPPARESGVYAQHR